MFTEVEVAAMLADITTVRERNLDPPPVHHHLQSLQKRDLTPPVQPNLVDFCNKFAIAT